MNSTGMATRTVTARPDEENGLVKPPDFRQKTNRQYKFIRSIGFGGMKAVLLVYDMDTGREVAMAMMPDFQNRSQADLTRFMVEARITARLEHPNIIPVHEVGTTKDGKPYFVMKLASGLTLAKILKKLRLRTLLNGQISIVLLFMPITLTSMV